MVTVKAKDLKADTVLYIRPFPLHKIRKIKSMQCFFSPPEC